MTDDLTRAIADKAAETIRAVDGKHTMGAGALGDEIAAALAPLIEARVREARAEALSRVADKWQWGDWANAPRGGDIAHERIAAAQYVTAWLRARAEEVRGDE